MNLRTGPASRKPITDDDDDEDEYISSHDGAKRQKIDISKWNTRRSGRLAQTSETPKKPKNQKAKGKTPKKEDDIAPAAPQRPAAPVDRPPARAPLTPEVATALSQIAENWQPFWYYLITPAKKQKEQYKTVDRSGWKVSSATETYLNIHDAASGGKDRLTFKGSRETKAMAFRFAYKEADDPQHSTSLLIRYAIENTASGYKKVNFLLCPERLEFLAQQNVEVRLSEFLDLFPALPCSCLPCSIRFPSLNLFSKLSLKISMRPSNLRKMLISVSLESLRCLLALNL
jgi:hypothetical protein